MNVSKKTAIYEPSRQNSKLKNEKKNKCNETQYNWNRWYESFVDVDVRLCISIWNHSLIPILIIEDEKTALAILNAAAAAKIFVRFSVARNTRNLFYYDFCLAFLCESF